MTRFRWIPLLAASLCAAPAAANPLLYVYKGAGCDGHAKIPAFEAAIGRKVDGVADFYNQQSWPALMSGATWSLDCWKNQKSRMMVGLPLVVKGGSLRAAADGAYDANFREIGALLVKKGRSNTIIRLGWEFNGDWYPWAAGKDPKAFVAAFRHVVAVLRSVPGQKFRIVWNPALGVGSVSPDQFWPGNDAVDIIGLDVYNQGWRIQDRIPAMRWPGYRTANFGLDWAAKFAPAHAKPLIIPEWGTGTRPDGHGWGDDPDFIRNMATWMRTNRVALQAYWDYPAPDYNSAMSKGQYPRTLNAYRKEFGGTAK